MICSAGGGIRVLHVGNKSFFSESVARCCHHVARFGAQSAINRLSEHAGLISIYAIWAVSYEQYPPAVPDIEYIELACESGGNRMPSAACFGPLSVSRSVTVCVRPQEYAGTDGRTARGEPAPRRFGAALQHGRRVAARHLQAVPAHGPQHLAVGRHRIHSPLYLDLKEPILNTINA